MASNHPKKIEVESKRNQAEPFQENCQHDIHTEPGGVMKIFYASLLVIFVNIAGIIPVASANMMQGTWAATIFEIDGAVASSQFEIGDTVTWHVLYDDTATSFHTYYADTHELYETVYMSGSYSNIYYSDAIFDFDGLLTDYFSSESPYYDIEFAMQTSNTIFGITTSMNSGGHGVFGTYGDTTDNDWGYVWSYQNGVLETLYIQKYEFTPGNPVPEPSSILLVGTSLIGIGVSKVRRNKQKG